MNLDNDFKYFRDGEERSIPAHYKEMAHLRYTIGGKVSEQLIPFRWHALYDYEDSTVIEAVLDRPVGGFTEMSVSFDYTNCVSSVELVTEHGPTRHLSWNTKTCLRPNLFHAVKFLTSFATSFNGLCDWKVWRKSTEGMMIL